MSRNYVALNDDPSIEMPTVLLIPHPLDKFCRSISKKRSPIPKANLIHEWSQGVREPYYIPACQHHSMVNGLKNG